MNDSREPSVPPRIELRAGFRPAQSIPSLAAVPHGAPGDGAPSKFRLVAEKPRPPLTPEFEGTARPALPTAAP